MRDVARFLALVPLLIVVDLAMWAMGPERRLTRSAIVAGIVAGRFAAQVAW